MPQIVSEGTSSEIAAGIGDAWLRSTLVQSPYLLPTVAGSYSAFRMTWDQSLTNGFATTSTTAWELTYQSSDPQRVSATFTLAAEHDTRGASSLSSVHFVLAYKTAQDATYDPDAGLKFNFEYYQTYHASTTVPKQDVGACERLFTGYVTMGNGDSLALFYQYEPSNPSYRLKCVQAHLAVNTF